MAVERKRAGSLGTLDDAAYFMTDFGGPVKAREQINSDTSIVQGFQVASTRHIDRSESIANFFESSWAEIFASKSVQANKDIAGTYKFVETLSESPRGTTSLAIDTRNSLRVAVRKVKASKRKSGAASLFRSPKAKRKAAARQREEERKLREQFCNEVEILKDLRDSPYIIKYMRTVVLSATPLEVWLVTEWCEGNSVASVLKNKGSLSLAEAVAVTSCVLLAVQEMQEYGYIHANISPKSVLLSHAGVAKLSSLSLAHRLDDYTSVKQPLRQVNENYHDDAQVGFVYLAPETLKEGRFSFASDIWALGVLLLEMFTGCQPYGQTDMDYVAEKVQQLEVAPGIIDRLEVFGQPYDGENDSFFHAVLIDILRVDPAKRPSVKSLLDNTMFAKTAKEFRTMSKTGFVSKEHSGEGKASGCARSVTVIQSLVFDGIL